MKRFLLHLGKAVIALSAILAAEAEGGTPIRLAFRDTTIVGGTTFPYTICVDSSLSGYSVRSYQVTVRYDTAWFSFRSGTSAGTIDSAWGQPVINEVTPGTIRIASAGTDTIAGTGVLVVLEFNSRVVSGSESQIASFVFESAMLNEGFPPTDNHSGTVTLIPVSSTSTPPGNPFTLIPFTYSLFQNFPNPFNPSTVIRYGLRSRSTVRLVIFNILGQKVAEPVNGVENEGFHSVTWSPSSPSGVYFYKIEATSINDPSGHFTEIRKMILMK